MCRLSLPLSTASQTVAAAIARCAAALGDLPQLSQEVAGLKTHPEPLAHFASALFDLERARRGDPEARTLLIEVAESLLVFWKERTAEALAAAHPALGPLWEKASALLVSFEVSRFKSALNACWEAKEDAALLQVAIESLLPVGNRRVEFAACLYHLELARLSVNASRAQFARRAGLVHEAYHSKETADELVGDDPGLQHLWKELVPYLDEFFEALEAEQERKLRSQLKTDPGGEGVERAPSDLTPPVAVTFVGPTPAPQGEHPTRPLVQPIDLPPPPPRVADSSGVFDLWLQEPNLPSAPAPAVENESTIEVLDEADPLPSRPPLPPSNFTPEPGSLNARDIPLPDVTAPSPRPRPPPPPNSTPILPLRPVTRDKRRPVGNDSGILDLQDIVEETPAAPPRRPRPSLDVEVGDYEPDAATQLFWRHTEEGLGLLPSTDAPRMDRRALSAEGRTERKKLNVWLDSVSRRFNGVPEARTFSCLMKLYLAAQLKEKGLFGGANTKRKEAFVAALELLSSEPLAAGHCAVWFELDGRETIDHLGAGLEVLTDYLQFCARKNLDPLDPQVPAQFMA